MDAHPKVVARAEALPAEAWKPLERLPRYEIATRPRSKPERVKESIVRCKGYTNKVLEGESVAELSYQPLKCARSDSPGGRAPEPQRAKGRGSPLR